MSQVPKLVFPRAQLDSLRQFSEAAYPEEGCGVLLGLVEGDRVRVTAVLAGRNLVEERRRDRYELDPRDIIQAERQARAAGQELVGFYHTHPDHPARPSQYDTERAWPGYHYVVVGVAAGTLAAASAWRLVEGEESLGFQPAQLIEADPDRGYNPPGLVAEAS